MEKWRFTKNRLLESVKQLFQVPEKLIMDQAEIGGLTTIDCQEPTWRLTNLQCDKAIEITNAQTEVFADSVLCLGSISDQPVEAWKNKIKWYLENRCLKDLNRIDGEPMEFEWKIVPEFTALGILEEIQKFVIELQCEPEQFERRIIFMSMYIDTIWGERGNTEKFETNSFTVANDARRFPLGRGHVWDLDRRRKGAGLLLDKPDGKWDKAAQRMMLNFAESGHPFFRATSALERGDMRSKGKGKKSIHFNDGEEIIETILRTIICVNQLSISGAVAELVQIFVQGFKGCGEPAANEDLESMEIPAGLPTADPHTNAALQRDYELKFEQLPEDQKLSKLCSDASLKIVEQGHFFITLEEEGPDEMKSLCREYSLPRSEEASRVRGWILGNTIIGLGLGCEGLYRNHCRILVSRLNSFLGSSNCEWSWQIRNRNVRNHSSWKRWVQSCRETCCESKATTNPCCDTVAKILVKHRRTCGSSRKTFVWSPACWLFVGQGSVGTLGKSAALGMCICSSETTMVLIGIGVFFKKKMAGRKRKMALMWKKLVKLVDLGRTNIEHDWGIHKRCSKCEFVLQQLKITRMWETLRKDGCVVLR